jgi:ribonuclease HI
LSRIGRHDNNVAEYAALLEALRFALELGAKTLHVFSDSEIVVKQMTGGIHLSQFATLFSALDLPVPESGH